MNTFSKGMCVNKITFVFKNFIFCLLRKFGKQVDSQRAQWGAQLSINFVQSYKHCAKLEAILMMSLPSLNPSKAPLCQGLWGHL